MVGELLIYVVYAYTITTIAFPVLWAADRYVWPWWRKDLRRFFSLFQVTKVEDYARFFEGVGINVTSVGVIAIVIWPIIQLVVLFSHDESAATSWSLEQWASVLWGIPLGLMIFILAQSLRKKP